MTGLVCKSESQTPPTGTLPQTAVDGGELDLGAMVQPVPASAVFQEPGYHIWCFTLTKGDDGKYHAFYSRWPYALHHRAWVTHCEVAHAVGDTPLGPFKFHDVALPARGGQFWDGSCTHNPTVFRGRDGKYYLYHMGNTGDGKDVIPLNMVHRNNQRIGVAIADSPNGPWRRFDRPALDVSADPEAPDALMVSNPAVTERPEGGYLMIYKGVSKATAKHKSEIRFFVATSERPEGPFKKYLTPVLSEAQLGVVTEDPCVWRGKDRYWCIMRLNGTARRMADGRCQFSPEGKSLALFESEQGLDWKPAQNPFIADLNLKWAGGKSRKPICIERPQIYLESGVPQVLIFATTEIFGNTDGSFDVFVPLSGGSPVGQSRTGDGNH